MIVAFGAGLDGEAIAGLQPGVVVGDELTATCAGHSTHARALAAVALRARQPGALLLFSGRGVVPDRLTEADAMRGVAVLAGVASSDILLERDGRDTADSSERCARMLRECGDAPVIVVAGERQLWRAATHLRAFGVQVHECHATHAVLGDPGVDRAGRGWDFWLQEGLIRILTLVDRRGRLLRGLAGRARP